MTTQLAIFPAYILLFSLLFYTAGVFLFYALNIPVVRGAYKKIFAHLFGGILLFTTAFAIWRTSGNTIFLTFILLGIGIFENVKSQSGQKERKAFREYFHVNKIAAFEFFLITLVIFLLHYYFIFLKDHYTYPTIFKTSDLMFYANIAEYISYTGIESYNFDYINISENAPMPYHYFEIWLNSFICFTSGKQSFLTQELISIPILCALIYAGMLSLMEKFVPLNNLIKICAIGFLFFSGINFLEKSHSVLAADIEAFTYNTLYLPRCQTAYIFLIAFLMASLDKKYNIALFIILGLGISSVATMPSAVLSLAFLLIFSIHPGIRVVIFDRKTIIICVLTVVIYSVFYSLNQNKYPIIKPESIADLLQNHFSKDGIAILFHIVAKTIFQTGIIYFPFILLLALNFNKIKKYILPRRELVFILLFAGISFLSSLMAWAFFNTMIGSVGLFSISSIAFLNISIFSITLLIIEDVRKKQLRFILNLLLLLWCTNNLYSTLKICGDYSTAKIYTDEYIKNVAEGIKSLGNYTAYDYNVENSQLQSKNPLAYPPRYFLGTFKKNICFTGLFMFDFKLSNDFKTSLIEKNFIKVSQFGRFVNNQKQDNAFVSINQSKLDFLRKYRIKYFFISPDKEIASSILPYVKSIIRDEKSGERCVIIGNY